ncbi:MAG: ATP-binding protein [bacterium]
MPRSALGRLNEILLDNLDDSVMAIDREGKVLAFNQAASELFSIPREKILKKSLWDALKMSDFTRTLIALVKEPEAKRRDMVVIFPGDKVFLADMLPVRGADGRLQGAIAILKDLTELRRIEQAMHHFVANVSHELKTPLTAIKGFVETLLEGAMDDPEICHRFLHIINDETNRLARLIISLLDISSMAAHKEELKRKPVQFRQLLDKALKILEPLAARKNVAIEVLVSKKLPYISVDEDKISQVLVNLLDNAIKFTALKSKGSVTVEAQEENDGLRVSITDKGIGIPADEVDKIFDRFYRVKSGPSAELGGTGLGLSITRQIVEAHGGTIDVSSTFGQGSTFTFFLPAEKAPSK